MDGNNMNGNNGTVENVNASAPASTPVTEQPAPAAAPTYDSSYQPYSYNEPAEAAEEGKSGGALGIVALILGILSTVCCLVPCVPIGTGIAGIILGINGQKKSDNGTMPRIGMILSIVGVAINVIASLVYLILFISGILSEM